MTPGPDGGGAPLVALRGITKRYGGLLANDGIDLAIGARRDPRASRRERRRQVDPRQDPLRRDRADGRRDRLGGPAGARSARRSRRAASASAWCSSTSRSSTSSPSPRTSPSRSPAPASLKAMRRRLDEVSRGYGLGLEPDRAVWTLSAGERQRIEIVRCLLQDPKLIVLDEPTSVLTPQEAERLFETLERLAGEGRAILYISHKLEEVRRLCRTATVLRNGRVVATLDPREAQRPRDRGPDGRQRGRRGEAPWGAGHGRRGARGARPDAAGRESARLDPEADRPDGPARARSSASPASPATVRASCSRRSPASGSPRRRRASRSPAAPAGAIGIDARRRLGAAFVPEERLGHAAVPTHRLSENAILSHHATGEVARGGIVALGPARRLAESDRREPSTCAGRRAIRRRASSRAATCRNSSSAARSSAARRVLVVDQPTWGVDAGAARLIRQALIDLARRGRRRSSSSARISTSCSRSPTASR